MSVDLEDYYCDLPFVDWPKYQERVTDNTKLILDLFERYNVSATFFTLGYVAEKFPELIETIVAKGHEIATHSYAHLDARKISEDEFENDLKKSIHALEHVSGNKVLGFRAPFFSISKNNLSLYKILEKYVKYDSSIFPVKTSLYGIPEAPRFMYTMSSQNPLREDSEGKLIEIPPSTMRLPFVGNLPIAGGFYLRFLPIHLIQYGISKINKNGNVGVIYIHPKDLDAGMPKISQYSWHYYWRQESAPKKFESLLKRFKFTSARDVLSL